jgi:hypothetical protein
MIFTREHFILLAALNFKAIIEIHTSTLFFRGSNNGDLTLKTLTESGLYSLKIISKPVNIHDRFQCTSLRFFCIQ